MIHAWKWLIYNNLFSINRIPRFRSLWVKELVPLPWLLWPTCKHGASCHNQGSQWGCSQTCSYDFHLFTLHSPCSRPSGKRVIMLVKLTDTIFIGMKGGSLSIQSPILVLLCLVISGTRQSYKHTQQGQGLTGRKVWITLTCQYFRQSEVLLGESGKNISCIREIMNLRFSHRSTSNGVVP